MTSDDYEYISDDYEYLYYLEILDILENRETLAEKVLSLDGLSQIEKEFIHKLILPPEKLRGRKNNNERDMKIAIEERWLRKEGKKSKEIMKDLGEKFELPGLRDVADRTYYTILKSGKDLLASYSDHDEETKKRKKYKAARSCKQ